MTLEQIAKRMTKVELLENVENLLGKIDDLLAERDRLREALSEALDELSWSEEDDYLTAETRASRDRWMSKMRRIAALQEAGDD